MLVKLVFLFTPSCNTVGTHKGKKIYNLKWNIIFIQHISETNQGAQCNKLPNDSETILWDINIKYLAIFDRI